MKFEISLSEEDIQSIARQVADMLKPLFDVNKNGEDELLTIDEAATLLKRSRGTIYQLVNNAQHGLSKFPYLKQGRRLRFSKNTLLKWSNDKNRVGLGESVRKKMVRRCQYHANIVNLYYRRKVTLPVIQGNLALIK